MRRTLGDQAPVLLPPACFLRDRELAQKLLWEGMTIVQPWDMDDIAPEVGCAFAGCMHTYVHRLDTAHTTLVCLSGYAMVCRVWS